MSLFQDAFNRQKSKQNTSPEPSAIQAYSRAFFGLTLIQVDHLLGRLPEVQVLDPNGYLVLCSIKHNSQNQFMVEFSIPASGTVIWI